MSAKNEEKNLSDCLNSVKWADEIVVIDSASDDNTVEVAKRFTPKVFTHQWEGYSAAKNRAIGYAEGEWILWIDADERVTEELANEIKGVISSPDSRYAAYSIPRKANFLGRWIMHGGWYPGRVTRLFKKGLAVVSDVKVHEGLEVNGEIGKLNSDLLHYTDPDLFHYFRKFNNYTSLSSEELVRSRSKFRMLKMILNPLWLFTKMYIIKRGFLDGMQGFILAVLSSFYVFTKYAKHWELIYKK
jgi:glycosyltransferase involved in cell wall biosynthesis